METIKFKGYEWIKLEENDGKTRLFLKNTLDEDTLEKCVEDEWYLEGCEVRLTENVRPPFNWENSYVKKVVLENFKKILGIECDVDLISKEEAEELNLDVRESDNRYWTKTSSNYDIYACAFYVDDSGIIYDYGVGLTLGLRPVIQLDTKLLKQSNGIGKLARCDDIKMTHHGELYKPTENEEILRIKVNELIDEINNLNEE